MYNKKESELSCMYHIISNPVSGRNKKQNKKSTDYQIRKYLDENKIEYKWYVSEYSKHPKKIAQEISEQNESGNMIVIGGDGTFNEVLNGIKNLEKWNVGLIPSGSGNDFASNIGFSKKKPIECIQKILKNQIVKTDLIKVNDIICMNVLGTGIDVDVLLNFEKFTKLKGKFRYFVALLVALCHFSWYEFDISLDEGEFVHKKGFLAALCNGSSIGGGIPICPGAKTNDHQLEFVFVHEIKKWKIPFYLIKLMSKKILKVKACEHVYCEKATIRACSKDFTLQIDGNLDNSTAEYSCEIIKDGLNLYR